MRRDVFQAISDPTRRDILNLIAHKTLTPNDVAGYFDVSRQAISKHIKILTECGILVINQKGRKRFCSVQPQKLDEVSRWLTEFQKIWDNRFDRLDKLLTTLKTESKSKTRSKTKSKKK